MSLTKSEVIEKNRYELQFSVDKATFDAAVNNVYRKQVKNIAVPGFRKGKAPRSIIEKMYGTGVFYEDAINDLIPEAYTEALKEAAIDAVGQPEFDVVSIDDNGLLLSAKVYVKPEVEIKDYLGIEVEKEVTPVSDEDVDREIETIRERNSREIDVTDRAAELGDTTVIDFEGFCDGVAFEGGKGEDYDLVIGSHSFIDTFEEQLIGKNKLIMRWLSHRGGALDYQEWCAAHPGERFPVSVALGADPATILGAVTPVPDTLSEYAFAGLLRGTKTEVVKCISNDLEVPASAEIVLEGYIEQGETAPEGPYGDHTGYYNEVDSFPVFTVTHITQREDAIYHSTYTGRPPDEPAVLGVALNEVFVPILQKQFPEIVDFYLPPEGCSYRLAVVTIKKQYAGHAKRVMMGVWSFLRQFMYTKFVIVCDDDVNARDWNDVIWAITTRMDPARDTVLVENTPIDYLDFASPVSGLGSKMGLDATNKWPGETQREWGRPIKKDPDVVAHIDAIWDELAIFNNGKSA